MYSNINGDNMDMVNLNEDNYNFLDNMDLSYMPAQQHDLHNNVRAETNTDVSQPLVGSNVTRLVNLNTQSLLEEDININESTYAPITNYNENQADVLDHSHDNIINKQTVVSDSKVDVQSVNDMTDKNVNRVDVQSVNDMTDKNVNRVDIQSVNDMTDKNVNRVDVQSVNDMTDKNVNRVDVQSVNDTQIEKRENFNNIHPKNVIDETENNNCLNKIVLFGIACFLAYKLYKNRK